LRLKTIAKKNNIKKSINREDPKLFEQEMMLEPTEALANHENVADEDAFVMHDRKITHASIL